MLIHEICYAKLATKWEKMFTDLLKSYFWVFEIVIILITASIINIAKILVFKKILPKMRKRKYFWSESFLEALSSPIKVFIWITAILFSGKILFTNLFAISTTALFYNIYKVFTVVMIVWFLIRLSTYFEENLFAYSKKTKKLDKTTLRALTQFTRLFIIILALLIILQTLGIPISGVIAFGGVGGIAIGFAAKDLLANFFGSIMIYWDKPFTIGEWIKSKDFEGTVEHIGWRLTRIRTFDKRALYIPNSLFSSITLENPARMTNRRIKTHVGLRYQDADKLAKILGQIENMLKNHEEIDMTKTMYVKMVEFGSYSLIFEVYTFTKTTDWVKYQDIQQDVFLKILEIIKKNNAECAFPTTSMHFENSLQVGK